MSVSGSATWKPYLALVLAMALWGSSFPAFKYVLGHFDSWFVIWARMVLAGGICLLLMPFHGWPRLERADVKGLVLMGFFEPCLYFLLEAEALRQTTSAQAGVIVALLPLIVAVAAGIFLQERITGRVLLGMLLAVGGAAWMSLSSSASASSPNPLLGNLLEFAAMVCASGYVVVVKRLSARYSPFFLVAVQSWTGFVFFLPLVLWRGSLADVFTTPTPTLAWATVVYLGAVVSILAFYCNNVGLRHIPANRATVFGNLIPVFAVALGVFVLGEPFEPMQIVACALILAGLVLSQSNRPRVRAGAAPTLPTAST